MRYVKDFFIGLLQGMFFGFGGNAIIFATPYILKKKQPDPSQGVINYNFEDRRTIQIICSNSAEPREVNHRIIAISTNSVDESDFS